MCAIVTGHWLCVVSIEGRSIERCRLCVVLFGCLLFAVCRENDITRDRIALLVKKGANVVLTTKGIDDMALKHFVDNGVIAVRRCKKSDLKNLAKATGGSVILSLADEEGGESVDEKSFGECGVVEEGKVGDGTLLFFKECKTSRAQTIILRGANDFMLDEIDRSMHDALSIVKRAMESKAVVPGGGAVEAALSVYMEHLASTMGSREQLAIAAFAQAMLIIPKTLAVGGRLLLACSVTRHSDAFLTPFVVLISGERCIRRY